MAQRERYEYTKANRYRLLLKNNRIRPHQLEWLRNFEASKDPNARQSEVKLPPTDAPRPPSPEGAPPPPSQGPPPLPLDSPAPANGAPGSVPNDLGAVFEGKTPDDLKEGGALADLKVAEAIEAMYAQYMIGWSAELRANGGTPLPDAMIIFGAKCAGRLGEKYGMLYLGEDSALLLASGLPVAWAWNESRKIDKRHQAAGLARPGNGAQLGAQNGVHQQHQYQAAAGANGHHQANGHQQRPPQPPPQPAFNADGWRPPDESGT